MTQTKKPTYNQFLMVPLRGRTLTIQDTPEAAVRSAVKKLLEQGFTHRKEDLGLMLRAEGSAWTAHVLEIGTARGSFLASLLTGGDRWAIPSIRQPIAPTLAVAAARRLPDGLTELVVMPILRRKGSSRTDGAGERMANALDGLIDEFATRRQLNSLSRPQPVCVNVDCPAHPRKLRKLIGQF